VHTRPGTSAIGASGIGRRGFLAAGTGAALAIAILTEHAGAAPAAKSGWRWCTKCRGLFAGKGSDSVGVCPKGGAHRLRPGDIYVLLSDLSSTDPTLIKNWYQCEKCRSLFAIDAGDTGVCPKGGAHKRTGPAYDLWKGTVTPPPFMEAGWDQCVKCNVLCWVNAQNGFGVCPAGGTHQAKGDNYKLIRLT
jgi:hypothetical protein